MASPNPCGAEMHKRDGSTEPFLRKTEPIRLARTVVPPAWSGATLGRSAHGGRALHRNLVTTARQGNGIRLAGAIDQSMNRIPAVQPPSAIAAEPLFAIFWRKQWRKLWRERNTRATPPPLRTLGQTTNSGHAGTHPSGPPTSPFANVLRPDAGQSR